MSDKKKVVSLCFFSFQIPLHSNISLNFKNVDVLKNNFKHKWKHSITIYPILLGIFGIQVQNKYSNTCMGDRSFDLPYLHDRIWQYYNVFTFWSLNLAINYMIQHQYIFQYMADHLIWHIRMIGFGSTTMFLNFGH